MKVELEQLRQQVSELRESKKVLLDDLTLTKDMLVSRFGYRPITSSGPER